MTSSSSSSSDRPLTHLLQLSFKASDEDRKHFMAYMTQPIKVTFNQGGEEEFIKLVWKERSQAANEIQFGTISPLQSDLIKNLTIKHIKGYREDHKDRGVIIANVYMLKVIGSGAFGSV